MREELESRLRFETLLTDLSSKFVNLPADEVDREIEDALRRLCECLGFDLSAFWQQTGSTPLLFTITHLYRPGGGPPLPERPDGLKMFPWSLRQLLAGKIVSFLVDDPPPEAEVDLATYRQYGIQSSLTIPLSVGGGPVMGILSFNVMRPVSDWSPLLVDRLKLVGQIFANALARKSSEKKQREDAVRLAAAIQAAALGLYEMEADNRVSFMDDRMRALLGVHPDQVPSSRAFWLEHIHPDDLGAMREVTRNVLDGGTDRIAVEYRYRHPDGSLLWLNQLSHVLERDRDGKATRVVGVLRDITARKQAEEARRESEARLFMATDSAEVGVWDLDCATRIFWITDKSRSIFGYAPDETVSLERFDASVHPDDRDRVRGAIERSLSAREPVLVEYRIVRGDGNVRWISSRGRPSFKPTGEPDRLMGVSIDITDRKQAVEALRRSELKYRQLHESMMDAFVRVDMEGRIQECNGAYLNMLGYSEQEIGQLSYVDLTPVRWHAVEARIVAEQVLPSGASSVYEKEYRRKDGTLFPVEMRTFLVRDDAGRPSAMWAIVRDITERKRAQDALRASEERFRILAETALVGIYILQDGTYAYVNPAMAGIFGYTVAEMTGMRPSVIVQPRDHDMVGEHIRRRIEGEVRTAHYEVRCRRKDGSARDVEVYGSRLEINGKPALVGTLIDITAQKQAEEARRESEARYREIFDGAIEGMFRTSPDGKLLMSNASLAQMLGYSSEKEIVREITNTAAQVWAAPEDRARFARLLEETGSLRAYECRFKRRDGTAFWVSLNARVVRGPDGHVAYFDGFVEDISERKRVADALEKSENRFRTAFMTGADAYLIAERDTGRMTEVNDRMLALYGYTRDEFVGHTSYELGMWVYPEARLDMLKQLRKDGRVENLEVYARRKGGEPFWVLYSVNELKNEGTPLILGAIHDITDRKRKEEALEQMRWLHAETEKLGKVGGWEFDIDTRKQIWTGETYSIHEMDASRQPTVEEGINYFTSASRPIIERAVQRAIEHGEPYDVELDIVTAKGNLRKVHAIGKPDLARRRVYGFIQDITEQKRAEAETQRLRQDLSHVSRVASLGEMVSAFAHELNQPLGAILTNAEAADLLLRADPPDLAEALETLADIRRDDERAGEVIRRIRGFLRKRDVERAPLDLNDLVQDMVRLIQNDAALREVSVETSLAPDLPPLKGDRIQLQQVLVNLAINAMDAMAEVPVGKRRLVLRTVKTADGGVEISVTDSGPGIPHDRLPRLFEPFYTTKPKGLGMGLAISRTIVEAHGGRIAVENNPGGGATLRVTLPPGGGPPP